MKYWTTGISSFLSGCSWCLLLVFMSTCTNSASFGIVCRYSIMKSFFLHQNNTGQTGEDSLLVDVNVEPSWIQGFTGSNIIVAVIDDGKWVGFNKMSICLMRNEALWNLIEAAYIGIGCFYYIHSTYV